MEDKVSGRNPAFFIDERDPWFAEQGLIRRCFTVPHSDLRDLSETDMTGKLARNEPLIFGHGLQDQIGG